jgi:hypothetical protein
MKGGANYHLAACGSLGFTGKSSNSSPGSFMGYCLQKMYPKLLKGLPI